MKKLAVFFIGIVFSCSLVLGSANNVFAEGMATSAKMIKLKLARYSDLVLCATNKTDKVIIDMALLVEENSAESLSGGVFDKNGFIDHETKRYQEFLSCGVVVVVERERLEEMSWLIANILTKGLPITVQPQLATPPTPESSSPATSTPRRSYF
jgi:hypothetical protein